MSDIPYVFCYMMMSLDGKTTGNFLFEPEFTEAIDDYFKIHTDYQKNKGFTAFCVGKGTCEGSLNEHIKVDLSKYQTNNINYEDFRGKFSEQYFAVLPDRKGTLLFSSNIINCHRFNVYNGAHIIIITTKKASKHYLSYLQSVGISYIIAGEEDIDIKETLKKLYKNYGINKLLLEGGPTINTSFFKADCINQIGIMYLPITGETKDKGFFDECCIKKFKQNECVVNEKNHYTWINFIKV